MYPPHSQRGHPLQHAPPPKKKYTWLWILLGGLTLSFGSCASYCGYALYQAQTPAGKKETKEREEHELAQLNGFVAKLGRLRAVLPTEGDPELKCPTGTLTKGAPILDSFFLDTVLGDDGDDEAGPGDPFGDVADGKDDGRAAASKLLRDGIFSDSIPKAIVTKNGGDAGSFAMFSLGGAALDIERIDKQLLVVILRVDDMVMPEASGDSFSGGDLMGAAVVVDWKTEKLVCHTAVTAKSSDDINYGGGVRFKVKGIPMPSVGKTDLDEAITKDFKRNVDISIRAALNGLGAVSE